MLFKKGVISKDVSYLIANLSLALRCVLVFWHMHTNRNTWQSVGLGCCKSSVTSCPFPSHAGECPRTPFSLESENF